MLDYDHSSAALEYIKESLREQTRPCILLKPKLFPDGDKWCTLYGDNLQDGLSGFGDTPSQAFDNFDRNYYHQKVTDKHREAQP